MKALTTFLLTFIIINIAAQKRTFKSPEHSITYTYKEVFLWEAYPVNGNIIFGVAKSETEITEILKNFEANNKGGVIVPKHKTVKKEVVTDPAYFDTFDSYCPKDYRILKLIDLTALRILKHDGLRDAAIFYSKKAEKNYGESMEYLSNLHNNFKPYRFKENNTDQVSKR